MTAFILRMPSGVPGALSRTGQAVAVEPGILLSGSAPPSYGVPVAIDPATGHVRGLQAGDVGSSVYAFLVRPFPTQGGDGQTTGLGVSPPPSTGAVDLLKMGYMSVASTRGTASKNSAVYARVAANASYPSSPVGGIEAAGDTPTPVGTAGTNTGNGTIGSLSATAATIAGSWKVVFTGATTFGVFDPNGVERTNGTTGTAYTNDGLSFTITAGATAFVANDSFTVAVTQNNVQVPDAYFTGAADSSGNAEIAFNI